jgi:hypothetical protein
MKTNNTGACGMRVLLGGFLVLMMVAGEALAAHPGEHAPIGVMGDHTHDEGEWMFSYRYMRMGMNGLRDDAERISRRRVLDDFPVTPTSMDMEMHMFGAMYAPIEGLTVMLMIPYALVEMEHRTRMGVMFATKAEGIGDVRATALVDLYKSHGHSVHANIGLSFPTGSLAETDRTPASGGAKVRLPYPMQLGSGTFDFLPGLTYNGHDDAISWGAQARGEIRLNENHADYTRGNEYALTAWGAYELTDSVSLSLRSEWQHELNIRGRDASLNPQVIPTADPGRRAAMRLDWLAGVNFAVPGGVLEGIRIAIEGGLPVYQRLDGPGLETDWIATFGIQYAIE